VAWDLPPTFRVPGWPDEAQLQRVAGKWRPGLVSTRSVLGVLAIGASLLMFLASLLVIHDAGDVLAGLCPLVITGAIGAVAASLLGWWAWERHVPPKFFRVLRDRPGDVGEIHISYVRRHYGTRTFVGDWIYLRMRGGGTVEHHCTEASAAIVASIRAVAPAATVTSSTKYTD